MNEHNSVLSYKVESVINLEGKTGKCVVVFSGGQDSTTCLGMARSIYREVYPITFNYGQKHVAELVSANLICKMWNLDLNIVELPFLQTIGNSALVAGSKLDVNDKHPQHANLPASFVPNRNALFLTVAHAYAQSVGADVVITGVCETDYSGYPDCRDSFICNLEKTLNEGYETNVKFVTPLMALNKAETFLLAARCNCLNMVVLHSHTCYNNNHSCLHAWGYGCGECPACKLRAHGYEQFQLYQQKLKEESNG